MAESAKGVPEPGNRRPPVGTLSLQNLSLASSMFPADGTQHIRTAAVTADASELQSLLQRATAIGSPVVQGAPTFSPDAPGALQGLVTTAADAIESSISPTLPSSDFESAARDRFSFQFLASLQVELEAAGISPAHFLQLARAVCFGFVSAGTSMDECIRNAVVLSHTSPDNTSLRALPSSVSASFGAPGTPIKAMTRTPDEPGQLPIREGEVSCDALRDLFARLCVPLSQADARALIVWSQAAEEQRRIDDEAAAQRAREEQPDSATAPTPKIGPTTGPVTPLDALLTVAPNLGATVDLANISVDAHTAAAPSPVCPISTVARGVSPTATRHTATPPPSSPRSIQTSATPHHGASHGPPSASASSAAVAAALPSTRPPVTIDGVSATPAQLTYVFDQLHTIVQSMWRVGVVAPTRTLTGASHRCMRGAAHHTASQISDRRILLVMLRIAEVIMLLLQIYNWSAVEVFAFLCGVPVGAPVSAITTTHVSQERFVEAIIVWCGNENERCPAKGTLGLTPLPPIPPAFLRHCAEELYATYAANSSAAQPGETAPPPSILSGDAPASAGAAAGMDLSQFGFMICDFQKIYMDEYRRLNAQSTDVDLLIAGRVLATLSSMGNGDIIGGIISADVPPHDGQLGLAELRSLLRADGSGIRIVPGVSLPIPNERMECLLNDYELLRLMGGREKLDLNDILALLRGMVDLISAKASFVFQPLPEQVAQQHPPVLLSRPHHPRPPRLLASSVMTPSGSDAFTPSPHVPEVLSLDAIVSPPSFSRCRALMEEDVSGSAQLFDVVIRAIADGASLAALFRQFANADLVVLVSALDGTQRQRRCRVLTVDRLALLFAATGTTMTPFHALGCMRVFGSAVPPSAGLAYSSPGPSGELVPIPGIQEGAMIMTFDALVAMLRSAWDAAFARIALLFEGPVIRQFEFATMCFNLMTYGSPFGASRPAVSLPDPISSALRLGLVPIPFFALWNAFDSDRNGSISILELYNVLAACGVPISAAEMRVMFNTADVDGDGRVRQR